MLVAPAVTYWLLYLTKCRNPTMATCMLLFNQFISFYVSWVTWAGLHSRVANYGLPHLLWQQVKALNATGCWTLPPWWWTGPGVVVSGGFLWICWIFEFVLFLGPPCVFSTMISDDDVFCENCDRWCEHQEGVTVLAPMETESLRQTLEGGHLENLQPRHGEDRLQPDSLELHFDWCEQCRKLFTVSALFVKRRKFPGSDDTVDKTLVLRNLLVTESEFSQLQLMGQPPQS